MIKEKLSHIECEFTCDYCRTKPAITHWTRKEKAVRDYRDGHLFIAKCNDNEYHCQDCYDLYGYDFEKDGWDENDIEQDITEFYEQGEQDEDAD